MKRGMTLIFFFKRNFKNQRAETLLIELVALDEAVEEDLSSGIILLSDSMKAGRVGCLGSKELTVLSKATTSDIVGLKAADD